MGAPFEGSWDAVKDAAYYAGSGWELIWLLVSIVLCIVAIGMGHAHESKANHD